MRVCIEVEVKVEIAWLIAYCLRRNASHVGDGAIAAHLHPAEHAVPLLRWDCLLA